jgi:hypothetical protein
MAASYAAELRLHDGHLAAAVDGARLAAVQAEAIGWQSGTIRALLVQAAALTRQGHTADAAQAARAGLRLCGAAEPAAITSFAVIVACLLDGHPEAGRLADAARSLAGQPGGPPYATVQGIPAGPGGPEPVASQQVPVTQPVAVPATPGEVRDLALALLS